MQPAVYREDLYRLKLSESPTKSEALSFRIRRYADTVLQSSHKAILKVPASKKFVLYLKATASVFSLANKIYRIFTKEITPIEGLDPAVRAVMMQGLEKLFDQYAEKMISPTILKLGLLKKCKSDYFDQLVVGVCKQIPVEVLRKLQAEKIKGLFDEGYLETFKEVLSEVGSDWALDKVEAFLTQQVVDSLDILAQGKDALIDKEWISISRAYHAEKIELVDGRTTIDLYSIDALGNGLIDQDLGEVVIYRYAELTQEQLRQFDELVSDVKNPAKHLGAYAAQFPEVIAHHLGKKHQKVSLKKDPLLGGNYLLLKAQQQLPSKNCLISLLLAETSLLFFQRQKSLSQEDLQALSSQLNHLIARIKTAPEDAGKNRDLTAAEELKGKVRKELVKRIKSQAAASPPIQDHVIPPFVYQIIHGFFSQVSAMPVLFEQIGIGLEIALGPDCRSLIAAARKEYEKFQATQPKKLDFSSVKLPEYAVSLGAFAFLHFAVYDLIFIALGFIFPPAWAYGSLVKGVAAASASLTCAQHLLPERMEMIAIRAIHHILFVAVPHLVALSIYFFVSREIQAELQYQIKLIDALTFKTTYRPTEENIAAKVILPDQTPYQTAQELSARLRQNREEFHQAILQELDECQQDEMVAQLEKTLAKIAPCESVSCDSRALEFVWQRCRPEEKELVNFTLDLLRPSPIASKALFKQVKLVWTNKEGGKKSFKVICTFDSDSEQSIESDLDQLVKSLQPGQMARWCAKLEAADPQKRGVSLLRRYEIFAMDHLAIETGTALIGLGRLHQLSSKALSDHLLFWKKIVEAELDFPDFSGEEKANLAQILLSTAEDLKRHRREKITFFPSSIPSALKKGLADQLTYFRSELPQSLPKPPSFPGLVLAPEEKIGDGQVFRSPDRVAALAPSVDASFVQLLQSVVEDSQESLFSDAISARIKAYPSKTKQEAQQIYQQIYQQILELETAYPADSVTTKEELFLTFNQMCRVFHKQLRLVALAREFGFDSCTLSHIEQAALYHFGQAVSQLKFVHLTIEAPFFSEANWTSSHTMQLYRLIDKVDDTFRLNDVSFELRVWLAGAAYLVFKLMDRERPEYRLVPKKFEENLRHAGLLRTSKSPTKFLSLYRRLVAEFSLGMIDQRGGHASTNGLCIEQRPPGIWAILSRTDSAYIFHGDQRCLPFGPFLNPISDALGYTETPLEDLFIWLKQSKRRDVVHEDIVKGIAHTFHTQVVSDLTRYEKEISLNLKLTFELFDRLKDYQDEPIQPLLAFLEECLVRRAPGFLPRLKDRCIHEKIVLNAVHFADAEEDVLRFLLVDCESSSPALEALAVPIRTRWFFQRDRLASDDAFIKRVVAYLMRIQSQDPLPLDDFRVVAIDQLIVLENDRYRVAVNRGGWIVTVQSLEKILRKKDPSIQRFRHLSDITYDGIDCFPVAFKKQCDAKDFFASVGTFQEESLIVIHRQQKVQQVLRVNHEKKEQLLKSAIIFPSKPFIRIPTDPIRLPAHIARFFIGQELQFYDTPHHGIVVELVSASLPFSLQFDQDQVTCSLHPEAKLSLDQTFADRELFPNYLIFEHGKKKFALVVSVPFFAAIPSHFSHPWRENIAAVLPMIPAAGSLQDMRHFHLVALTDQRKVAPVTTDDFALILFGTYAKDGDRFDHALSLLMQKIELEEPLHGQIKPWLLFLGLSLLQNISKDQVTRQKILKALISFIAKQAPELSLVEKAPVVLSTVWIYLQDLMAQDDELTPVSAEEGMLLKEFFGCIEAMNVSQADHPKWHQMIAWLHQFFTIPELIELLSTDALTRRLEAIDAKYHESWVPKGSKILWGALQAPTKYWFSSPPLKIFVKWFIQSKIFWVFWKFSTAPILTLKSLGRVPDQKFAMTPKAFMESEVHLKECFHNYLEILFQKDSSPLKLDLETSLDSPWIMDTSHRLVLKFLRWIYRKKKAHGEMNLPTDLKALLEEFYRLESSTRQVSWTHLIRSELEKAGSSVVTELGKHSKFEVARMISGSLKAVHSALPILNSFFPQRLKPLEPQKVMGQVLIGQSVVDHNAFFHQIFCQIATRYFNAYLLDRQEFQSIRHDGGGHALQSYFAERVESSFEALRKIPSELSYALKSGRSLATLKDEIQAISAQLTKDCQLLEQKILNCVREVTGLRVPIDQLYHLALKQDGVGLFSQQYQLRPKQAAILMDQLIKLALCQTYRVKCSSILQLIEEGSIDAAAKKILEPKNYPLATDRDHRLMLGCLVFEAKNQVWLRPLQAKQMILALEGEKQSHLIEMIPGSGKTAYAILMDCYHRHEKGCALFAILTKELITSMRQDVASRFYRMTGKSVFFMAIDRQKTGNLELERLKLRMMRSEESGDVIITTKEDLQAIELLYLENLLAGASFDERKHRVLKELLGIVSNSHGVVDECHEILRPDESEKFPLGSAQSVNREEILGIEVVVKFLHQVKTDSRQTFSAIFTSSDNLKKIAQAIAFQDYLGITADQQQELTRYLSDITVDMPRWLLSHPAKRQLVMSRGVMTQLIPACVKDKVHTTYGLSRKERDQKYVIPFSSNNTPIEGSIFQSPHETLFKTYLYYLESPGDIDLGTLRKKIHEQLLLEADRYYQLKESTPFASTIVRLFGSLDPTDQELNHQPAALALLYVTLAVAPTLKFFEYSIESTSASFAAMLGTKDYFSGTTYNCSLYPQPFKTLAVKETTAMTLHSVKTQFERSGKIVRVAHAAECIEKMDSFELLIDSGALFNGYSNLEVAELIAHRLKETKSALKAVLFFDEANRLKALLLETEGVVDYDPDQLSPEERVTYLDQSHTFGVDIPQKRGAKALVTIGGNHLAQFEQACWRLRGLKTLDQSVSFALLPDVPSACLDFDHLIAYLVRQEHELLKSQGVSALFQQMYSGVRKLILQKSWSEDVRSAKRMIEAGREFFVEQQILDPLSRYAAAQNELPTERVIERFRSALESKIRAFRFFTPQEQEALIQGLPSSEPIIKPATTLAAADLIVSIGGAVVKQQQRLMEEVRQLQREVIHAQPQRPLEVNDPPYRSYPAVESFDPRVIFALTEAGRARNPLAMPVHAIQSIFAAAPNRCFQVAAMFLSPEVLVAENLMPSARIEEIRRNIFKRWIGRLLSMDERIREREICDLLLIQNKTLNRWDVMALDLRDSIFWEKKLLTGHPSTLYRFSLVKLETGSCVHKTFAHADTLAYMHTPEFKKLLLQYKILNCSDDFTGQEQVMLLQMIRSVNASGISFHEMKQALNAYYQIQRRDRTPLVQRRDRTPLAQSPLVAFIDQLESADRTTSL